MPTRIISIALAFGLTVLLFYVLISGKDILVPFAIAIMLWYLLNAITRAYSRIPFGKYHLPRYLALALAIITFCLVIALMVKVISVNMMEAAKAAPVYQARLEGTISKITNAVGWQHPANLAQLEKSINLQAFLTGIITTITGIASNMGIIFIYVTFLFVEQMNFDRKIAALFKNRDKEKAFRSMLTRMENEIETYLLIKTVMSLITGGLSYFILIIAGVDYAAFWGFLIFLLNFIPTIGALLAIIFPSLLTLVQFDGIYVFLAVTGSLSLLQFLVSNLWETRVMGKSLNLSSLVIVLALVLWGSIWGIAGMFLAVPITVMIGIVCSLIPQARPVAVLLSSDGKLNFKS